METYQWRWKCIRETKSKNAVSGIQVENNVVIQEIAEHENINMTAVRETGDMRLQELSKGELINVMEKCRGEWGCSRGSDAGKNFTMKELLEIFHDTESTKDKILDGNLILETEYDNFPRQRKDACFL